MLDSLLPAIQIPQRNDPLNPAPMHMRIHTYPQNLNLLEQARLAYESLSSFRERRRKARDHARGDANDAIYDPIRKEWTTEDARASEEGRRLLRMRKIRPIIRNLRGQFRSNKTDRICLARNRDGNEEAEQMTEALRLVSDVNNLDMVDADTIEEEIVSGLYGWKDSYRWHGELNRPEVFDSRIAPERFFFNAEMRDRRLTDLTLIGEILDLDFDEVVQAFAKTPNEVASLKMVFPQGWPAQFNQNFNLLPTGRSLTDMTNFYQPVNPNKCRVIEMWRKEYGWHTFVYDEATGDYSLANENVSEELIANLNAQRAVDAELAGMSIVPLLRLQTKYESVWRAYWMSGYGHVLKAMDTPYWHESHPYTIGFAHFFDGEISGLVEDLIDPQRHFNTLINAMDKFLGSGGKGLWLIDENILPEGMTPQQFAEESVKFGNMLFYKAKTNHPIRDPIHIPDGSIPASYFSFLATLDKQLTETSGVQDAALGVAPQSGTPASLYAQQVAQSSVTTRDFFDSFFEVRRMRDLKIVKLIQQFWDEPRWLKVKGQRLDGAKRVQYDPNKVRGTEFDLELGDIAATVIARQTFEQDVRALLSEQRITFRQYLMASSHPKADYLLALIEQTNPMLADSGMDVEGGMAIRGALLQKAQAGDKDAIALLGQAQ